MTIALDDELKIADVVAVARDGELVDFPATAREKVVASNEALERVLETDRRIYGVNTGFGDLQDRSIGRSDLERLQRNLLRSHDAAVGEPVSRDVVRAALLVRAKTLAAGVSGVRPVVVERLVSMLNEGVHPVIRGGGSTDDLGAVANVGLVLIGEGRAEYAGEQMDGGTALEEAGLEPVSIGPKEGLALLNGPYLMTAMAALAIADADRLVRSADIVGALTFDRIGTHAGAFDPRVFEQKPLPGAATSAANLRALLDLDSDVLGDDHLDQDPLSIRCLPQVHGVVREFLDNARRVVQIEINGPSDNPLVFPDESVLSSGSYSGLHVATVIDSITTGIRKLGVASERRTDKLLTADDAPSFLASDPGLESGMMIAQYTSAGLLAESPTETLSDRSITVSGGQEDVHSLGTVGARRLHRTIERVRRVLAVELLCAVRFGLLIRDTSPSTPVGVVDAVIESIVRPLEDAPVADRIEQAAEAIEDGTLIERVAGGGVTVH